VASIFSKEKRIIYARRITGFWDEFKRKRIGLVGVSVLIFFVALAIFAPWLTPYDPVAKKRVADDFAMPEWMTIFPAYKDLPTTIEHSLYWDMEQGLEFIHSWGKVVTVKYKARTTDTITVELSTTFSYSEIPPRSFYFMFEWKAEDVVSTEYSVRIRLYTPEGENQTMYLMWQLPRTQQDKGAHVDVESVEPFFRDMLGFGMEENPAPVMFSRKGEYTLLLRMQFKPLSASASCGVELKNARFVIPGRVHGVLGCDDTGADLFSQLIYGTRISLLIGILCAIAGASIGILVGVITGYFGGIIDEVMMRLVDILLCLPFLPLLLTLVFLYGKSIFYIVVFIAIFGWQGLARMIRSQVLSLRETSFIECARAVGASRFYIIMRHIVPNVLPVAFASLILSVPGAILFEAALSFLGFGDPRVPTWGKMLHHAYGFGAFTRLAWWWIIPPGLCITTLCLAFVFMGHSLDEVVNPRLRRRR